MNISTLRLVLGVAGGLWVSVAQAQTIKLTAGSLDFLKTESALNVGYEYDGLTVGSGTEKEYIDKKVAEANKDEAGKGDKWLESWKADRAKRYQPKFEELVNKQFTARKSTLSIGENKDAKYTLVLKTTNIEPGWNVGISRRDAAVSVVATFVETGNRSNVLAVVSVKDAPGRGAGAGIGFGMGTGFDYDAGVRIMEGYAKAGKELAQFIWKSIAK